MYRGVLHMSAGSTNRYVAALWKFLGVVVVLHLLILTTANFMSDKVGLFGLKVFWAHISSGLGTISIALVLAVLVYCLIYRYWTR
jgi:hypothetical protein